LIVGSPAKINYSIRDTIKEVEGVVGRSLPKAWKYWNTYKGETEWGNSMFFVWDKRTHWAKAQGAVTDLQSYLKKVLSDYEEEQKRKAREAAKAVAVEVVPTWQKYLPIGILAGTLLLGFKGGK